MNLSSILLHKHRDVLPVSVRHVHVLNRHHVLPARGPVHQIHGVGSPVGDDLEDGSGAVCPLHGDQAAPGALGLLEVGGEDEASLALDGVEQVPEGELGH